MHKHVFILNIFIFNYSGQQSIISYYKRLLLLLLLLFLNIINKLFIQQIIHLLQCKLPIVNRKLQLPLSRSRNCLTDLRERTTVVVHFSEDNRPRLWHPTCFHCSTCHLQLVDLIFYPLKWSQLCCSRHHAEMFMPRCHECDEVSCRMS